MPGGTPCGPTRTARSPNGDGLVDAAGHAPRRPAIGMEPASRRELVGRPMSARSSRLETMDLLAELRRRKLLAIIRADGPDTALACVDTLVEAGITALEISLTTPGGAGA